MFSTWFGEILRSPDGSVVSTASLAGKDVIGLYFSAHWCPPCRAFTPILSKKYSALKAAGKAVEFIFLSSDRNEAEFNDYHSHMSFLALPYAEREHKATLSSKFGVRGIPTLVFVDGQSGEVITTEGRKEISQSNFIDAFPFKPRDLAPVFSDWKVFGGLVDGKTAEAVVVFIGNGGNDATHVMPKLKESFNALQGRLAVVYVPCNVTDSEAEAAFVGNMPAGWTKLSIEAAASVLAAMSAVEPVDQDNPTTLVLTSDAKTMLAKDASRVVYRFKETAFPWTDAAIAAAEKAAEEEAKRNEAAAEAFRKDRIGTPGFKFLTDGKLLGKSGAISGSAAEYLVAQDLDVLGVYFSAHWCGPCRRFTPLLARLYNELRAMDKKFEIVFVSGDKDEASFNSYFESMPWLALQFDQRSLKSLLNEAFNVEGIPTLMLIDGKTGVTTNGDEAVELGAAFYPWTQKAGEEVE